MSLFVSIAPQRGSLILLSMLFTASLANTACQKTPASNQQLLADLSTSSNQQEPQIQVLRSSTKDSVLTATALLPTAQVQVSKKDVEHGTTVIELTSLPKTSQIFSEDSAHIKEKLSLAKEIPSLEHISLLGQRARQERWSDQHTLRHGPIPDYAPLSKVYAHQQLAGLAPEASMALVDHLKDMLETEDYDPGEQLEGEEFTEDTMLLWMRDYHPIYVRKRSGELAAIHYLAHNPNRARYAIKQDSEQGLTAEVFTADTPKESKVMNTFFKQRAKRKFDITEHIPLLHENGNLIIVGPWVFLSERILEDNSQLESDEHLITGGYLPRGKSGVIKMISEALEVPTSRVIILPNLPHEATGHVDLYLMAINDHQVLIPKIVLPMELLSANPVERGIAEDVQEFLDDRAEQLAKLGLDVIRLPQLPPLYLPALDEPEGNFDVVFYSPTNGLLIKTSEEQRILLPHFEATLVRPEFQELSKAYEDFWHEAFILLGWHPIHVETTTLGRYLGLIHCVTAATPKLPLLEEWLALKAKVNPNSTSKLNTSPAATIQLNQQAVTSPPAKTVLDLTSSTQKSMIPVQKSKINSILPTLNKDLSHESKQARITH